MLSQQIVQKIAVVISYFYWYIYLIQVSKDPKAVLNGGGLMPLGGTEETSGYKGYGLAMLVEIFCGILANGAYGPKIRKWKNTTSIANLVSAYFLAIIIVI